MQKQYGDRTDGAKKITNPGAIILSINRVITLWQEDIAESVYFIRHHKVNIQALENHINLLGTRLGSSDYFMKQSAAVTAKIGKHRTEIDRRTDFIRQTEQDIVNMAQIVNVFKHSAGAAKNVYNNGNRFISTVESINRAVNMLDKMIADANDAQIAEYLDSRKDGSEFVGKNHFVIDTYKQDIENLTSLYYGTQETRRDDFYQKTR